MKALPALRVFPPPPVAQSWNGSLSAQASDVALGFSSQRLMSPDPKVGGSPLWVLITSGHMAACIILLMNLNTGSLSSYSDWCKSSQAKCVQDPWPLTLGGLWLERWLRG